jgi:hypothetical protein
MNFKHFAKRFTAIIGALVLAASTHFAFAEDTVRLKDGRTITGDIQREVEGSVWIKTTNGGIESTEFILGDNIESIDRDAPAETPNADIKTAKTDANAKPRRAGVPRAAVISLEGTVGIQMTAKTLMDLIPVLERELGNDGSGIVVFKINSGGGLLLEIQKLSDVIHNEYKKRFRTVSWIESAISAAAMTSHCVEEIYMLPEGSYGACTGWSGALVAMKGRGLEGVLYQMEKISARGGYDYRIMRAMEINEPLSCTIDPRTGEVTWYQTEEGEYLVNPGDKILTFTAPDALKYKFSKGTAANLDELTKAMGYQEIDWVGEERSGFIYPISKAEDMMLAYREKVTSDEERTNEYFANYGQARAMAEAAPIETRARFVGRAKQHLRKIESMVRNNPNFALLTWGMTIEDWERDWLEVEKKALADLMRP